MAVGEGAMRMYPGDRIGESDDQTKYHVERMFEGDHRCKRPQRAGLD